MFKSLLDNGNSLAGVFVEKQKTSTIFSMPVPVKNYQITPRLILRPPSTI